MTSLKKSLVELEIAKALWSAKMAELQFIVADHIQLAAKIAPTSAEQKTAATALMKQFKYGLLLILKHIDQDEYQRKVDALQQRDEVPTKCR